MWRHHIGHGLVNIKKPGMLTKMKLTIKKLHMKVEEATKKTSDNIKDTS